MLFRSLFSERGWKFPLTISNIPNNTKWETGLEIEKILPENYATVTINRVINIKYKYLNKKVKYPNT